MSWLAKIGFSIGKIAARYGIAKFVTASLEIKDLEFEPIRLLGDDHGKGSAIVYRMEVENSGVKPARNCRPYLRLRGVAEVDEFRGDYFVGEDVVDVDNEVEFSLDTRVFWSDEVEPANHFDEGTETDTQSVKTLSPSESVVFTFAMVVAERQEMDGPRIALPSKDRFDPPGCRI